MAPMMMTFALKPHAMIYWIVDRVDIHILDTMLYRHIY